MICVIVNVYTDFIGDPPQLSSADVGLIERGRVGLRIDEGTILFVNQERTLPIAGGRYPGKIIAGVAVPKNSFMETSNFSISQKILLL